jgi:CBS domain-containing protein
MAQSIRSVMTSNPVMLPTTSSVAEAARAMRDANISVARRLQNIVQLVLVSLLIALGHGPLFALQLS